MRIKTPTMMCAVACLLPGMARAQLPERFTLGRMVPDDCWMVLHFAHNPEPERAWIEERWTPVCEEFQKQKIWEDVKQLVFSQMGEADRAQAEAMVTTWSALLEAVDWEDLVQEEFVFAERLTPMIPDYMILVRGVEGSGEANATALAAILQQIAAMTELQVTPSDVSGAQLWTMPLGVPYTIELFRKGDVIGLVAGDNIAKELLSMLAGEEMKRPFVDAPRFQEALSLVPKPEDGVLYFDFKMLLQNINGLMQMAMAKEADTEDARQGIEVVKKVLDMVDMGDYLVATVETSGKRELTHSVFKVQQGKENCPLSNICLNRKPFEKFDTYIPVDATSFSVSGFIDLELAYKTVMDFIKNEVPDGEEAITEINNGLASVGFDPQADVFSWWSGEMISISLPAAMQGPMASGESVLMVRVKDKTLAAEKVNLAIDKLAAFMQQQGQALMVAPAQVKAEGFRTVTHPMMMMMGVNPVVGVHDEWLMLASSPAALNKCLDVASGAAPSIMENTRFRQEGLVPKGPVTAASFSDLSNLGQELAMVVQMIGMFGGMAMASAPPDAADEVKVVQKAFGILSKLGPVLNKIDFFSSSSSVCTREGLLFHTEDALVYKDPATAPAPAGTTTP